MNYKYDRKPKYYLQGEVWVYELIECWNWKEQGFLPRQGTWQDQQNFIVEGFGFIDYLSNEKQKKAHEATINRVKASKGRHGRK